MELDDCHARPWHDPLCARDDDVLSLAFDPLRFSKIASLCGGGYARAAHTRLRHGRVVGSAGGAHSRGMRRSLRFRALGRPESPMRRWTPTLSVPRTCWNRFRKGTAMLCSRSVGVPSQSLRVWSRR